MKMTKRERKAIYKRFFAGESVAQISARWKEPLPREVRHETIENIIREGQIEKWDSGVKWHEFDVGDE